MERQRTLGACLQSRSPSSGELNRPGLVRFKSVAVTIAIRPKRNVVDVRSHNPLGLEHVTPRIGRNRDQDGYEGRPQQHDPLDLRFPLDVGEQIASIMGIGTQLGGSCVRSTLGTIVAWPTRRHARAEAVFSPPTRRRVEVTLAGTVERRRTPLHRSSGSCGGREEPRGPRDGALWGYLPSRIPGFV